MGKKKSSGVKHISKGIHSTVSNKTKKMVRRERDYADRLESQLNSWARGRRTMITIENPNPKETNKRFIRVEGNIVFGPWKRAPKETNKND
jgi:hypothetical protein